jgi:DNA-binding PadR family transcriptional regulator
MENRTHPKDMIALTALSLLSEQPCHPYEIQRLMRGRRKDYAVGKTRALYRAMEELQAAGLIESGEPTREGKRPERTVYRITDEGREELENWLSDLLETLVPEWPVFSVAMSLLPYLAQERAEAALNARIVSLRSALAGLEEGMKALTEDMHLPRLVLLEMEHTAALRDAELRWVASILDDMRSGRLVWNEEIIRQHFHALKEAEDRRRAAHEPLATPPSTANEE